MNLMIPATNKRCAKTGCETFLSSYNEGRYCHAHSFSLQRPRNTLAQQAAERPTTFAYRLASPAPRQPWQPVSRAA